MTKKKQARQKPGSKRKLYPVEFKLRAVQLYAEEGYPADMVCEELGICKSSLGRWAKQYREEGAAGLEPRSPSPASRRQIDSSVKKKAIELKKADPSRGNRRISHLLRRFHLMKASLLPTKLMP